MLKLECQELMLLSCKSPIIVKLTGKNGEQPDNLCINTIQRKDNKDLILSVRLLFSRELFCCSATAVFHNILSVVEYNKDERRC